MDFVFLGLSKLPVSRTVIEAASRRPHSTLSSYNLMLVGIVQVFGNS